MTKIITPIICLLLSGCSIHNQRIEQQQIILQTNTQITMLTNLNIVITNPPIATIIPEISDSEKILSALMKLANINTLFLLALAIAYCYSVRNDKLRFTCMMLLFGWVFISAFVLSCTNLGLGDTIRVFMLIGYLSYCGIMTLFFLDFMKRNTGGERRT